MFSRRRTVRHTRGRSQTHRIPVPLPGTWDVGLWHADDLILSDGADISTWDPREGSIALANYNGNPTFSATGFFGDKAVSFNADDAILRADEIAAFQNGDDLPIYVILAIKPPDPLSGNIEACWSFGHTTGIQNFMELRFETGGNQTIARNIGGSTVTSLHDTPLVPGGRSIITSQFTGTAANQWHDLLIDDTAPDAIDEPDATGVITQFGLGGRLRNGAVSFPLGALVRAFGMRTTPFTEADIAAFRDFVFRKPKLVLFVGDSITLGSGDTISGHIGGGMRGRLSEHVATAPYNADFVGTQQVLGSPFSRYKHDGVNGHTIANIRSKIAASFGAGNAVPSADLVVVMIGANDMSTYEASTTATAYANMLDELHAAFPNAKIATTHITDQNNDDGPNVPLFNAELDTVWSTFDSANPGVRLSGWNANSAVSGSSDGGGYNASFFDDNVHPNSDGYDEIANNATHGLHQAVSATMGAW